MKKKSKPQKSKQRKSTAPVASAEPVDAGRRRMLRLARNGVIGGAVLGGAGWWGLSAMRATAAEHDLTRLGQGQPSVVQIHDPMCSLCTELQRNTRRALRCFDDEALLYLVASIRTEDGAHFAARHALPSVTLVLLDGAGEVAEVLQGVRPRDELKPHFEALVAQA